MAGIARELTGSGANKLGNGLVGVCTDLRHIAGKLNGRVLSMIEGISAVALGTHEMPRAVRFYRTLGFELLHGGEESSFTSFRAGTSPVSGTVPTFARGDSIIPAWRTDNFLRAEICLLVRKWGLRLADG